MKTQEDFHTALNDIYVKMCREAISMLNEISSEGLFNLENEIEDSDIQNIDISYINGDGYSDNAPIETVILTEYGFDFILANEYIISHCEITLDDMSCFIDLLREYVVYKSEK